MNREQEFMDNIKLMYKNTLQSMSTRQLNKIKKKIFYYSDQSKDFKSKKRKKILETISLQNCDDYEFLTESLLLITRYSLKKLEPKKKTFNFFMIINNKIIKEDYRIELEWIKD